MAMKKNLFTLSRTQLALRPEVTLIVATVLIAIFFSQVAPQFSSVSNLQNIGRWIGTYGFMTMGVMFVLLSGGIDLSIGSVVAFSSLILAHLIENIGLNWVIAVIATILIAAVIGVLHGLFVSHFSPPLPQIVPAFLITLITQLVLRGISQFWTRGYPIVLTKAQIPEFIFLGNGNIAEIPIPMLLMIGFLIISFVILSLSILGRHIYAVGGNLEAAIVTGIKVRRVRVFCYSMSSSLSAMTGVIITARLSSAYPGIGVGYELQAITASVLGGVSLVGGEGLPLGVLLGVTLMTVIENGLVVMNVSPYLHLIIIGFLLAVAVSIDFLKRGRVRR
jgi:ribose transport system permease protein